MSDNGETLINYRYLSTEMDNVSYGFFQVIYSDYLILENSFYLRWYWLINSMFFGIVFKTLSLINIQFG